MIPGSGGRSSGSGMGSSTLWRDSGRDGVFTGVEYSSAVTPVARETLLSAWAISSSSI